MGEFIVPGIDGHSWNGFNIPLRPLAAGGQPVIPRWIISFYYNLYPFWDGRIELSYLLGKYGNLFFYLVDEHNRLKTVMLPAIVLLGVLTFGALRYDLGKAKGTS
jgi:hypothetical protein